MSNNINHVNKIALEKVNHIIDNNLNNCLFIVADICNEFAENSSQVFRLIKEHFQLFISPYIRHRKLLKTKKLLDNSDLKIAEISHVVVIDSPQCFSENFTGLYGGSLTEYRKNKANILEEFLPFIDGAKHRKTLSKLVFY